VPTVEEVGGVILVVLLILFVVALLVFKVYEGYNPNNTLSRRIELFSNTPRIKAVRDSLKELFNFCVKAFWTLLVLWIVYACGDWYFNESEWYPREREIPVFFKANQWIEGEIKTCASPKTTTPKDPDAELKNIFCTTEPEESHVLKIKFWGPIKADREKRWNCERSLPTMTCSLQ
jgi:hypothetical protein